MAAPLRRFRRFRRFRRPGSDPASFRARSGAAVPGLVLGLLLAAGAAPGPAAADHFLTHPEPAQQAAASGPSISLKALTAGADAAAFVAARPAARGAAGEPIGEPSGELIGRPPHDAALRIAPRYVPDDDVLLGAYSADPKTRRAVGLETPGLLGIAAQTLRTQTWRARHAAERTRDVAGEGRAGEGEGAYSLADAMRDAIWRRETAAKLRETRQ